MDASGRAMDLSLGTEKYPVCVVGRCTLTVSKPRVESAYGFQRLTL